MRKREHMWADQKFRYNINILFNGESDYNKTKKINKIIIEPILNDKKLHKLLKEVLTKNV